MADLNYTPFEVTPLEGAMFDSKLRRVITSEAAFGEAGVRQIVSFDLITKARITKAFHSKEAGANRTGEDYFSVEAQYAPGKYRRLTAFSTQIPALKEAVEKSTAEGSEVDYINFIGEGIQQVISKGRNVPNEIRDTRGTLVAGIELVMKDGKKEVVLDPPGTSVGAGMARNQS